MQRHIFFFDYQTQGFAGEPLSSHFLAAAVIRCRRIIFVNNQTKTAYLFETTPLTSSEYPAHNQ
jgi:hypothetical protein